jgi:hypothetical protein
MAKRLQVILQDCVRQVVDLVRCREPLEATGKKLEGIRAAAQHNHPTADIDNMLGEIEKGRGPGLQL